MKKVISFVALLILVSTLFIALVRDHQDVQATTPLFTVNIIGGQIAPSNQSSHITVRTLPGTTLAMRVIFTCTHPNNYEYASFTDRVANSIGRYTWAWGPSFYASACNSGHARVIITATHGNASLVAQKIFVITPFVAPVPALLPPPPITSTTPTGDVNLNPWGYFFNGGILLYHPHPLFCNGKWFHCVSTFWTDTKGYVAECTDGIYTHSGGIVGACSSHGGVKYALYLQPLPLGKQGTTTTDSTFSSGKMGMRTYSGGSTNSIDIPFFFAGNGYAEHPVTTTW